MAPPRSPCTDGAGEADGVPRDHAPGHRTRRARVARAGSSARRRPGGAPHPRPSVRLRGLARAVAQSRAEAVGRSSTERGHSPGRGARARAHALPSRVVLGHRGHLREGRRRRHVVRRDPRRARRHASRHRARLRRQRRAGARRRGRPRRDRCTRRRRRPGLGGVRRAVRGGEAVPPLSLRAVHDVDAPAGGRPQAPLHVAADNAGRAALVRERLHHLHAHRLDDVVGDGARRGTRTGHSAVRRRLRARAAAAVREEGQERARGARGHPPCRRHVPHA